MTTDKQMNYLKEVCEKINLSAEATVCFIETEEKLKKDEKAFDKFFCLVDLFSKTDEESIHTIVPQIEELAESIGIHKYTLDFLFIVHCSFYTRKKYAKNGLEESLFWDGMKDLSYKLNECFSLYDIYGTFSADWYEGFLRLGRFTIGRFQMEPFGLHKGEDITLECGYVLKKDTRYLFMHIPASGEPFTKEYREQSYRQIYEHFKQWVGSDTVLIDCSSWLLFPDNRKILGENSNIVSFLNDFQIYKTVYEDEFSDAWRIFGKSANLPVNQWPENTSAQRQFKKWIEAGNKAGHGAGFIVLHNGENVTHIKGYFK